MRYKAMYKNSEYKNSERGNVLWFVTLAVVFSALLTIIVTRGSSQVEETGKREQITVKITQVLRYAKSIESAIQDMRIQGISVNDISFENAKTDIDYRNRNCNDDTDTRCRLFHRDGAGLTYLPPPAGVAEDGNEWIFTGDNNVGSEAGSVGSFGERSGNEILLVLEDVNTRFCAQLNRQFSITPDGSIPRDTQGISLEPYLGVFSSLENILDGDPQPFELDRQNYGCFFNGAGKKRPSFYYVLLAR